MTRKEKRYARKVRKLFLKMGGVPLAMCCSSTDEELAKEMAKMGAREQAGKLYMMSLARIATRMVMEQVVIRAISAAEAAGITDKPDLDRLN